MVYRCRASSPQGFLQQTVCYLANGYCFYVVGRVPAGKSPAAIDQKLIAKYEISASRQVRYRRRRRGLANVQYLRYGRDFLLLATPGQHRWFTEERRSIRDARRRAIVFGDYSIRLVPGNYQRKEPGAQRARADGKWRVRVIIRRQRLRQVKGQLLAAAARESADELVARFRALNFQPYAPVRRQLLGLLRQVSAARRKQGLKKVPTRALRLVRRSVKPFE